MTIPEGKIQYSFDYEDWYNMKQLDRRVLLYNGEIEDDCIEIITNNILLFNAEDKGTPVEQRKPIILYINSPGGSVSAGLSAISAIETSITNVYTVNIGSCMSMGFLLYLSGKKRYTLPHSEFLMHDGSIGYFGDSVAKARDKMEFNNQTEAKVKDFVLRHSSISEQLYDAMYRKEWYFYPEEGKKNGFVDYIIGQDCSIDEII